MVNKTDTRSMLLNDSPWKLLLSLSVPAIIGMVVVGLYNLMDAVYVGQMVGSKAMTAVSVSYPFTLVNTGISTLIGVGSASILSRAIGKKDQDTVDKIMGNLIALTLIFSIIIIAVGMIFTRQILRLSGNPFVEMDNKDYFLLHCCCITNVYNRLSCRPVDFLIC